MLRWLVVVLMLLNLGYFSWAQGWLQSSGWGPQAQAEPQRLQQQLAPESLRLEKPSDTAAAQTVERPKPTEPTATLCLQSEWLNPEQANTLGLRLAERLADEAWNLDEAQGPERWVVYMGKYANAAELAKKRAQLQTLKIKTEALNSPALMPGLSLGSFDTQASADAALAALAQRGVRTARVLQADAARSGYRIRLLLTPALQAQLADLQAALGNLVLAPCPP